MALPHPSRDADLTPVKIFCAPLRLVLLLLLPLGAWALAQVPVPQLRAPVTDLTQTLTAEQISTLNSQLLALQTRKGSQLAILMLPTTQPETIEQYSLRVVESWKLGRKAPDDGVLLIVAKNDHTVRIEVGYGLEGVLTDATTNRIIRQWIVPQFRSGNYYQGLADASSRLIELIDGEALPAPPPTVQETPRGDHVANNLPWPLLIFGVIFGAQFLRSVFGRLGAAMLTGAATGIVLWLVMSSILLAVGAAVAAFMFALISGGGGGGWSNGPRGGWSSGSGGWGGGLGGGGFSGGGGGFGGGGASGRW